MAVDHDPISELRESLRRRAPTWEPERPERPARPARPVRPARPAQQVPTFQEEPALRPRSAVVRPAAARPMLGRLRWPRPRFQVAIPWRQGRVAFGRIVRATRSFIVGLASGLAVILRSAARAMRWAVPFAAHAMQRALRLAARAMRWTVPFTARAIRRSVQLTDRATRRAWRATVPLARAAGHALRASWTRSRKAAARERARRRERAAMRAAALRSAALPQPVPEIAPVEPPAPAGVLDESERHLEELERRQLEQRIEALGPDHPDVAVMLQLVAERAAARGATDEALALYGEALRIQERTFGADAAALGPLLHDLADLERELGHDADAMLHEARREMLVPHAAPRVERARPNGGRVAHVSSVVSSNGGGAPSAPSAPPSNGAIRAN